MEVEVSTDLWIPETASKQQQRAIEASSRDNDALRFDEDLAGGYVGTVNAAKAVSRLPGPFNADGCLLAVGVFEYNPISLKALEQLSPSILSIRKERDNRPLFLGSTTAYSIILESVMPTLSIYRVYNMSGVKHHR